MLAGYNKLTKDIVTNKIKGEGLVNKSPVPGFINNADLDKKKLATLAIKAKLKAENEKILQLQASHLSYFQNESHFVDDDGAENYLVFQSM